jgi:hypothetical protein
MKMIKQEVTELMDINILNTDSVEFYLTVNNFVGLKYKDKDYKRVILSRILPLNDPDEYISIIDTENAEIGIIRSISELREEQAKIIRDELSKRYYCPSVLRISSVKEKMGYVYFDVEIKGRSKNFAVKDVSRNIRQLDDKRIMIFDIDGNRYIIEDINQLDAKSARRIEPYLF